MRGRRVLAPSLEPGVGPTRGRPQWRRRLQGLKRRATGEPYLASAWAWNRHCSREVRRCVVATEGSGDSGTGGASAQSSGGVPQVPVPVHVGGGSGSNVRAPGQARSHRGPLRRRAFQGWSSRAAPQGRSLNRAGAEGKGGRRVPRPRSCALPGPSAGPSGETEGLGGGLKPGPRAESRAGASVPAGQRRRARGGPRLTRPSRRVVGGSLPRSVLRPASLP